MFFVSFFLLVFISSICYGDVGSPIHIFEHCDEEIIVEENTSIQIKISGTLWSLESYVCQVTFKSTSSFDVLFYQFDRFDVNNLDLRILVSIAEGHSGGFSNKGVFHSTTEPSLKAMKTGGRYVRFDVTRRHLSSYDLSVLLTINSKATAREGTGLTTGQLAGVVVGSIVFIFILIILIVFCAIGAKYPDRRGSIYTVARRLSIFATPSSRPSISNHSEHSDAQTEKEDKDIGSGRNNVSFENTENDYEKLGRSPMSQDNLYYNRQ